MLNRYDVMEIDTIIIPDIKHIITDFSRATIDPRDNVYDSAWQATYDSQSNTYLGAPGIMCSNFIINYPRRTATY